MKDLVDVMSEASLLEDDVLVGSRSVSPWKEDLRLLHPSPLPELRLVPERGVEVDQEEGDDREQLHQHLAFGSTDLN